MCEECYSTTDDFRVCTKRGRKRSVDYVEPIEGESDKSEAIMKTSKPSGPIASVDILKAKKKDLSECHGVSKADGGSQETGATRASEKLDTNTFQQHIECNCSYLWSILSAEHLKKYDCWDCLWFPYYKSNASQRKKMLTWVKDKEVFLKKYSFVPICMW
ncbi:hypothetical protein Taro_049325 [Colocasia esculenta]|uniref:Uncharacterized protein n=1 Tax=Colocasia esculenta TaxID=4460 RepID=A0A843XAJ2_COLES|nr:hypothetical protein [Colocasia esculenta]